jgi:hypothetical protein
MLFVPIFTGAVPQSFRIIASNTKRKAAIVAIFVIFNFDISTSS